MFAVEGVFVLGLAGAIGPQGTFFLKNFFAEDVPNSHEGKKGYKNDCCHEVGHGYSIGHSPEISK